MALDKLGIYNDALLLIGERKLSSLTENREPRRLLDSAFDLGAIDYCLELVKPVFARKTSKLTTSVPSANHDLDNVFTLPSDWVSTVDVYSDSRLDQAISRYINENRTIACEFSTIYVRYVSNTDAETYSSWSPAFARVVTAYLARDIAARLVPDELVTLNTIFEERLESAIAIESEKEPLKRAKASTTTISQAWRNIYNDALLILGMEKIVANNDDSFRRSILDTAIDGDLVEAMLEDIGWHWAITSVQIEENPSLEPEWGYQYAFDKPTDLHRLDGVFTDEYFQVPLKRYLDEGDTFFADIQTIFIQYVSSDFVGNPSGWTPSFRKLISARLAKECAASLSPKLIDHARMEYEERYSAAKSIDAMQSPPRTLSAGNWVRSRSYGNSNRRRP